MKNKNLKESIKKAFPIEPIPESCSVSDDECLESKQVSSFLKCRTWLTLTLDDLHIYDKYADASAMLAFMSHEQYQYYLPAYLIITIDYCEKSGLICDAVIQSLCGWEDMSDETMVRYINERQKTFNLEQVDVIIEYLYFMRKTYNNSIVSLELIDKAISNMLRNNEK